jgi:hypothetical protein
MGNRSVILRKWLLTLHLLFSGIMLGVAVVFLVLSIAAATTKDDSVVQACYTGMHVLSKTAVRGSTVGTVVSGVMLTVLTQWGLFKFYWIIVKEGLTLLSIALGPFGMYFWTLKAVELTSAKGLVAAHSPAFIVNSEQLWTGIILQTMSLAAMFVISVFKPWGRVQRKLA